MKKTNLILVITLLLFLLTSCKVKTYSKEKYVDCFYNYHVLQKKDNACIDLRELDEYSKGHIKGFVNYNYKQGSKEEFIQYMTSMYDKDIYIFLIDDYGDHVEKAADILKKEGYKRIIICDVGYNDLEEYAKKHLQIVEGIDDCNC